MLKRHSELDMCHGPLFSGILIFALPMMVMNILQLLFNATNMVVVGRFDGSDALAAVGATGALISLLINLFMGLSVGTSVMVAQDYGAGKTEEVSQSVHTSIAVSLIGGVLVSLLGIALCTPLLRWMGTPENITDLAAVYMRIYFIGMPASMVYNFGAAVLRAVGDSKRPMYYLMISGLVNVVLSLLFVIPLKMGVAGVAWATTISQYLAVSLLMMALIRSDSCIRFYPKKMNLNKTKLKELMRIGLPAGLQGTLFSISNVMVQSAINSFGSTLVAANSAAGNVEGFIGMTMNAYYNAAITYTGQNVGAGQYKRIDSIVKVLLVLVIATWVLMGGLTVLLARPLLGIYTTDTEVIGLGILRIRIMMVLYLSCGVMNVFPGVMRGMGYSITPMLITLVGTCLLRIVWLMTVFVWYPTIPVLYACYPVTWTIAAIGHMASYLAIRRKRGIAERKVPALDT